MIAVMVDRCRGQHLRGRQENMRQGSTAVVSNLCTSLTHVDIRDLLEWAARETVKDMKLARTASGSTAHSARKATVEFESDRGAERALAALHGYILRGLELQVKLEM